MTHLHLILGSSSVSRRAVLEKLGLPFRIVRPEIDEAPWQDESPMAHVLRLAEEKAQRVREIALSQLDFCACGEYWIISSDQVAVLNGQLVSKPENHAEAVRQLLASSGKSITFYNGLCLLNTKTGACQSVLDTSTVHYKKFTLVQIEHYLKKDPPYSCAGSLKSEGLGIALIERIDSKDPNSLIGLPLIDLCTLFENKGMDVLAHHGGCC